jgi:hypothetical protein
MGLDGEAQAHLEIFRPLPSGDDVQSETTVADEIDRRGHRATMAGGITNVAAVVNNLIFVVTDASPAMRVKDSRL